MSDENERSPASTGSVSWRPLGMISDDRLKGIMGDVGMPNSRSLKEALVPCDKEARLDAASRLSLTDEERGAIEAAIAYMAPVANYNSTARDTLRGLLERTRATDGR